MELAEIRKKIDELDHRMLDILAERLALAPQISEYKKQKGMATEQPKREKELIQDRAEYLAAKGIQDKQFTEELFRAVMKKSKELQ